MDKFHTKVLIPESAEKIDYTTPCLFMGSCFSDEIGRIMAGHKFPVLLNPFGTLFNPVSIAEDIGFLINQKIFTQEDLDFNNGLWFSFSHYTRFSHPDPEACLLAINNAAKAASRFLKNCKYLMLTMGTAWAYLHQPDKKLVANCHKLPASSFTRVLLEPPEILSRFNTLLPELVKYNPGIRVIFTLSPVRHWADGAVSNQLGKSILHFSIHEILKSYQFASYFPAYEIFMDELRDYRFYAADMLHPSEQGTHYVWDRFCESHISRTAKEVMAQVAAILKATGHKPGDTSSESHRKFLHNTLVQIERLTQQYPFLDFSNEKAVLQN